MTQSRSDGEPWKDPQSPSPDALKEHIAERLRQDRGETDDGLAEERVVTDQFVAKVVEQVADGARERHRGVIDREVDESREENNARLGISADTLPTVVATLESAAESLTEVAESLSEAAEALAAPAPPASDTALGSPGDEAAAVLANIADTLTDVVQGQPSEPRADGGGDPMAPAVAEGLADVAESLADVASRIAEERVIADASLHEERRLLDELLERERQQADAILDFERHQRRRMLEAARRRTDGLLRKERENTDTAVDQSVHLLSQEYSARASAEHALLTREEFMAIISHDLRGPLDVVVINAALLAENAPAGESGTRVRRWAANIERAAGVMDRLLADLLDIARFEGGEFRLAVAEHDAVSIVKECVETFAPVAARAGLQLDVELPERAVPAHYDHDRLLQVLSNLLRNAVQFTAPGGSIVLALTPLPNACRIAVRDTGRGVPATQLDRIFERFQRLDASDRPGLGLGLYIAARIIAAHGGRIWVESKTGRGSTFFVELPAPNGPSA